MTQVDISNTPVAMTILDAESTTVPSGEAWKVKIIMNTDHGGGSNTYVSVNGSDIWGYQGSDGNENHPREATLVLTAGDTISYSNGQGGGVRLSGFVIK